MLVDNHSYKLNKMKKVVELSRNEKSERNSSSGKVRKARMTTELIIGLAVLLVMAGIILDINL